MTLTTKDSRGTNVSTTVSLLIVNFHPGGVAGDGRGGVAVRGVALGVIGRQGVVEFILGFDAAAA